MVLVVSMLRELLSDGQEVNNILRLNPDLSLDTTWSVTTDDLIYTIAVETDRILIGGFFTEVNGIAKPSRC